MTRREAAASLLAPGREARPKMFRLPAKAGPDGLPVGEIVRHLGLASSTPSHHLNVRVAAGLVTQERRGRETVNRADFAAMRAFVESECCASARVAGTAA